MTQKVLDNSVGKNSAAKKGTTRGGAGGPVVSEPGREPSGTNDSNVAGAVETAVASHLHPLGSYDVSAHPVPTGQEEVWRFTPVRRLSTLMAGEPSSAHLTWKYQLPEGVTVGALDTDEAKRISPREPADRLAALAVANGGGAVLIDVAAEREIGEPVVFSLTGEDSGAVVWGHVVLRLGANARATVLFEHTGTAQYVSNVTVLLGDGAELNMVGVQLWDDDAIHTGQISSRVGRDAKLRSFQASLGGGLVRLGENADYAGPGGEVTMTGIYFARGEAGDRPAQHIEHRLFVDHNTPRTRSRVDYRGALQGKGAHAVWVGDVLIRKVAEGIDTFEMNRNLLLTDGTRADSVPNLEIETGEIDGAGHASTTGRFDDEQLFYLMARGIPEIEARKLMVRGFFSELLSRVPVEDLRERLGAAIEARLTEAGV